MKKTLITLASLFGILTSPMASACTEDGKAGIFPENDLWIPAPMIMTIEQEVFMKAIDKAEKIYAPVFTAQGRTLKIERKWEDGTVNAYANRSGKTSMVAMFGGLARHALVTPDAFMMVICHELGHHLGGAPKGRQLFWESWASNEGQSDYFATLKCAREVWKDEDNAAAVAKMNVPQTVVTACQKSFDTAQEVAICQRSSMAGLSLANTLSSLNKGGATSFDSPDKNVVKSTNHAHPAAQCRLDTYFAGAICDKSKDAALDNRDATVGTCSSEKGETIGVRPLCWYKPKAGAEKDRPGTWPR